MSNTKSAQTARVISDGFTGLGIDFDTEHYDEDDTWLFSWKDMEADGSGYRLRSCHVFDDGSFHGTLPAAFFEALRNSP